MEILSVSYNIWKQVVNANNFSVCYLTAGSNKSVWAGTAMVIYETVVQGSDITDFATNYLTNATSVSSRDDGIALIVGISEAKFHDHPHIDPSTRALISAPTHGYFEEDAHFKGYLVLASGIDTDTFLDHRIDQEIYVQGGWFWSDGGVIGDYAEVSVVDKDDVLGYFGYFGLVSGVDVLELGKYVEHVYLKPGGDGTTHLETPTSAPVLEGLYMRTKVHTTSDTPAQLGVTYLWFEV